jgi:ligand-binding sensor domain-containing protein
VLAFALAVGGVVIASHRQRLRHLAVPVWTAPSRPAAARPQPILDAPAATVRELGRLPARVTALARGRDGALYAGTFDQGVFRLDGARALPVGALVGRERFINALVARGDTIVAGTYGGAIAIDADGLRRATHVPELAVEALLVVDGELLAGTTRGVVALPGGSIVERGRGGEPIRATALARSAGRLWIGSPDGVWSIPWPLEGTAAPSWHPLVFGRPGADTDAVTALVPIADGVLAGTDDGGVARVTVDGVRALRFAEPRADEINPGALARPDGAGAVWAGTQGGGLLQLSGLDARDGAPQAARPAGWLAREVSAVAADGGGLLVGTAAGELYAVD